MSRPRWQLFPIGTVFIVSLTLIGFQWEMRAINMGLMQYLMDDYAFHWSQFLDHPLTACPQLFTNLFFHADRLHLTSNLAFFFLFAIGVETSVGPLSFVILYFIWGAAACITQGFFEPFSGGLIGASGAISGAAGAFFVLHPLKMPFHGLKRMVGAWVGYIPAFLLIALWYGFEMLHALRSLSGVPLWFEGYTPIAHWAHIGGFTAGAVTMIPYIFRRPTV